MTHECASNSIIVHIFNSECMQWAATAVGGVPAPTSRFVTAASATPNANSQEHHCFAVCYILQDFEERETQKDSDNHCGARETESIRLELKLLKSNWSVGEKEQREELNIFTKELMNRLKVFM